MRPEAGDFRRFWVGQTLSGLGDAFSIVAVPLMALEATGSVVRMGQLTAVASVAHLVAALCVVPIAARVRRRPLMIACDVVRFAAWAALAAWWRWRGPSFSALVLATGVSAFAGNLFQVAAVSAIARLVERDALTAANGQLQGAYAAMYFVGPWAAGELCHRAGASVGVAVDAVSFAVSAMSLVSLRRRLDDAESVVTENVSLGEALRFLWRVPRLRALTLLLGASSLLLASRENLLVVYIKNTLRESDAAVGRVFAAAALGAVLGSVLARWSRARFGFSAAWAGAGVLVGAALAMVGAAASVVVVGACAMFIALGDSVRSVTAVTVQQESVPERYLGPVTAASQVLLTAPTVVGAWGVAAFAARFDDGLALAVTGVVLGAVMALGLLTPLRHAEGRVMGMRGSVVG